MATWGSTLSKRGQRAIKPPKRAPVTNPGLVTRDPAGSSSRSYTPQTPIGGGSTGSGYTAPSPQKVKAATLQKVLRADPKLPKLASEKRLQDKPQKLERRLQERVERTASKIGEPTPKVKVPSAGKDKGAAFLFGTPHKVKGETLRPVARIEAKAPKSAKLKVAVPAVVPPALRKSVAKQGQRLNEALDKAGSNLTGPEYLGKLIQFESGWNPKAENPSSAYGLGQFIDSTADDFRTRLGVETQDPSRPKQMIKGASLHASGKVGYGALYAGYNPGYSDTDPIPAVGVGKNVTVKVSRKAAEKIAGGAVQKSSTAKPVPLKELRQHVVFTEPKAEVASEQGAKAKTSLTGMSPELQRALVTLSKNTGIPVRINEGFRTAKRANEFPSGTASQHHQGNAADVDNNAQYTAEDLAKAGLNNTTVAGEPWHFQPNDPGTSTSSGFAAAGSSSGYSAPSGATSPTTGPSPTSPASSEAKAAKSQAKAFDKRKRLLEEIIAEAPELSTSTAPTVRRVTRKKVSLSL